MIYEDPLPVGPLAPPGGRKDIMDDMQFLECPRLFLVVKETGRHARQRVAAQPFSRRHTVADPVGKIARAGRVISIPVSLPFVMSRPWHLIPLRRR